MKMPRFFFKEQKASGFKYTPRYHDEEKNRKDARKRLIKREAELEKTEEGKQFLNERRHADREWAHSKTKTELNAQRFRLYIILSFLLILTFLLLKYFGIPIFGVS